MTRLAEILRVAGPAYREAFGDRMPSFHRRAMRDIVRCRTAELGGSVFRCNRCGAIDYAYHSCRNRHCPRCQHEATERWCEKVHDLALPCRYALLTFTLPATLRHLARTHQRKVYAIILQAAAASVQALAADPRWIGGQPGIVAILHTWARDLSYHPHAHLLVTAGGLTDDALTWRLPAYRRFIFPGHALSVIFRAKVRDALRRDRQLPTVGRRALTGPWVVHVRDAGDGNAVMRYLARYVHRVALTDDRIESFTNGHVTFRYRHARTRSVRRMTLPVLDFIARFLQHVLPQRFVKVRYSGLFAPNRRPALEAARSILLAAAVAAGQPVAAEPPRRPHPVGRPCPACKKGTLLFLHRIPAVMLPPTVPTVGLVIAGRAPP